MINEKTQFNPVSIIMPAYNAGAHIEGVFKRIPAQLWPGIANVWVIDDGSIDKTGAIANALAIANRKIKPIHFDCNKGYGVALKKGLSLCKNDGCTIALCLHADGQYPPEIIPGAIEKMRSRVLDIMQGSRIASGTALTGGMPLYKFVANRTLTFFENLVFHLTMTDYHSGMLFFSRRALETLPFESFSDSYDFDVEAIAAARANGLSIGEIPIPTHYGSEISHVRSIPYGFRIVRVMRKYLMGRYTLP
jgi:glycosyltransferase involved in cell wall biosynthesis